MFLEFHGASDHVTGSLHRLRVGSLDLALDCGLFQGRRAESNRRNREIPKWALQAHAVVLSHAHLDHSGNLPTLVKQGFRGNIYVTPATRDLCSVMLRDAAMVQEQDSRFLNRRLPPDEPRIDPLYTMADAQEAVGRMVSLPLHRPFVIAPGVELTFFDAGHVLGSALVQLDLTFEGRKTRLLYTGDLGREELPLLENPEIVPDVDVLLMESTYGDRTHPDIAELDAQLRDIIRETVARKGRVFIPTFALERAQEVLFALTRLADRGELPPIPIYIDSPLAIAVTEVYKLHPEGLDAGVRERLLSRNDPFSPPGLRYVSEVAASKALQDDPEPCIIIAGSGMCEGGRILHHFVRGLPDPRNTVVLVGFMAEHTLGRRLAEGRKRVMVFGVEREVQARVRVLEGLSSHADRDDLLRFVDRERRVGNVHTVALVHGETKAREALAMALEAGGGPNVVLGAPGARISLDGESGEESPAT